MKNKLSLVLVSVFVVASAGSVGAAQANHDAVSEKPSAAMSGNWTQIQKISGTTGYECFGASVSIDGDTALIGAWESSGGPGKAYVYIRNGGTWTQQAELQSPDPVSNGMFGETVCLVGDTALIGARESPPGRVYVFTRSGTAWTLQATLEPSDGTQNDSFGTEISMMDDTVVIGDWMQNDQTGSAYVFVRDGTTWSQQAKLVATDGVIDDGFGAVISYENNTAVISACQNPNKAGAVYVFVRTGSVWTQQAKLIPSDSVAGDSFGQGIAVEANTALIGAAQFMAPGKVYVFQRVGMTWTELTSFTSSQPQANDLFGQPIVLDGDTAFIGATGESMMMGGVYVFTRNATDWTQIARLTPSDPSQLQMFGLSISLDADTAIIGAMGDQSFRGAAYLFSTNVNQDPIADFTWTPTSPYAIQTASFDASASHDPDGAITLYEWDWNHDGIYEESQTIPTTTHVWNSSGDYQVTLRVTDDDAAVTTITKTITIKPLDFDIEITGGFGIHVRFINHEPINITSLPVQIIVTGGILNKININQSSTIDILTGETPTGLKVTCMGLGPIHIGVDAADHQKTATGTQILFFTLIKT